MNDAYDGIEAPFLWGAIFCFAVAIFAPRFL